MIQSTCCKRPVFDRHWSKYCDKNVMYWFFFLFQYQVY